MQSFLTIYHLGDRAYLYVPLVPATTNTVSFSTRQLAYTVCDSIELSPDIRDRRLELGNVYVPDIAPQCNIVDIPNAGTSYLYAQKETCSDQFWHEGTLQSCLLNQFMWPDVSHTFF